MPPQARICYICGRPTLLPGFDRHIVQCRDLFEKREMLKPPKERRQCPTDPCLNTRGGDLNAMNEASQRAWEKTLLPCQNCGRKFLPEKLPIHNRSCTVANPARRVNREGGAAARDDPYADEYEYAPPSNGQRLRPNSASSSRKITSGGGGYAPDMNEFPTYGHLIKCKDCGRNFNENSFPKHAKICRKVFQQKRKPFDSAKHRAEGTELAQYLQGARRRNGGGLASTSRTMTSTTTGAPPRTSRSAKTLPKWKAESLSFRQAIQQAKIVSKAERQSKATGIPLHALLPANAMRNPGYDVIESSFIRCPHCGRSFNEKAAERHIPKCQSIINKPSRLTKGSGIATKNPQYSPPSKQSSYAENPRRAANTFDRDVQDSFAAGYNGNGNLARRGSFSQPTMQRNPHQQNTRDVARSFASMSMGNGSGRMDGPIPRSRSSNGNGYGSGGMASTSSSSYGRGGGGGESMSGRFPAEMARSVVHGVNDPVRINSSLQRSNPMSTNRSRPGSGMDNNSTFGSRPAVRSTTNSSRQYY